MGERYGQTDRQPPVTFLGLRDPFFARNRWGLRLDAGPKRYGLTDVLRSLLSLSETRGLPEIGGVSRLDAGPNPDW